MHVSLRRDIRGYIESYHALSYTWGDSKPTIPIRINGKIFKVYDNLHAALQRLEEANLWLTVETFSMVDSAYGSIQICIDQSNVSERNKQVQQMHFIYRNAASVIIWLGKDHEDEDDNSKFSTSSWGLELDCSKWASAEHTMNAIDLIRGLRVLRTFVFSLHAEILNNSILDTKCWAHLLLLFKRTWSERLWICRVENDVTIDYTKSVEAVYRDWLCS